MIGKRAANLSPIAAARVEEDAPAASALPPDRARHDVARRKLGARRPGHEPLAGARR